MQPLVVFFLIKHINGEAWPPADNIAAIWFFCGHAYGDSKHFSAAGVNYIVSRENSGL